MLRTLGVLLLLALLLPSDAAAQSAQVQLQWNPSPDSRVVGYLIEYGTSSGVYSHKADAGTHTGHAVAGLEEGQSYYFVVRPYDAFGDIGPPSNEVVSTTPAFTGPVTELIWRHSKSGDVAQWQMHGVRQMSGGGVGPGPVDLAWKIVGTGDFNGDQQKDIVWQHQDGWISVWLMNGSKLLSGQLLQPDRVADTDWRIVAVADMDQDGQPDLVWRHQGDGHLAVWLMSGTTSRDGRLLEPGRVADLDWKIIGAGDFNGDKSPDLLWRHAVSGNLAIWYMSEGRQLWGSELTPATVDDFEWTVASVADLNEDGKADIVWQHSDGRLAVWMMDSSKQVSGTALRPDAIADTLWRIVAVR